MNIQDYLSRQQVPFQRLVHQPAPTSSRRANSVHTHGRQVAKTVLLKNLDGQLLVAVLPADKKIDWLKLATTTGKTGWRLATEEQTSRVFSDCEMGAWPPFGALYGVATVVDDSFHADSEILVEGNHRHEDYRMSFHDYLRTAESDQAKISRSS